MNVKAVIDRFEEEYAVLLLKDGEEKLIIPRESLPERAKEGHWLRLELEERRTEEGDSYDSRPYVTGIELDEEETAVVKKRISDKLARLRRGDHLTGGE